MVQVIKPKNWDSIFQPMKDGYVKMVVMETSKEFNDQGFKVIKHRTAFLQGKQEDMAEHYEGQTLPGCVQRIRCFKKCTPNHKPTTVGNSDVIFMGEGQPVYDVRVYRRDESLPREVFGIPDGKTSAIPTKTREEALYGVISDDQSVEAQLVNQNL